MGAKKELILFCIISVLFMSAVAANTQIMFSASPQDSVRLNVLNPDTLDAYQTFENNTDSNGQITFVFEMNVPKIALSALLYNGEGKIITMKDFGNYSTGSYISLDFSAAPPSNPANNASTGATNATAQNNTSSQTTNTSVNASIQQSNESSASVIGNVVGNLKESLGKVPVWAYWTALGAVVLAVLIWIIIALIKKGYMRKISFGNKLNREDKTDDDSDKRISKIEGEIKEAQAQVYAIKNKKKAITDAERRVLNAKEELERLKKSI